MIGEKEWRRQRRWWLGALGIPTSGCWFQILLNWSRGKKIENVSWWFMNFSLHLCFVVCVVKTHGDTMKFPWSRFKSRKCDGAGSGLQKEMSEAGGWKRTVPASKCRLYSTNVSRITATPRGGWLCVGGRSYDICTHRADEFGAPLCEFAIPRCRGIKI